MNNEDVLRLFDTYADDAFRLAYSYLGSRHDAEDIVQDVFVKLIPSARSTINAAVKAIFNKPIPKGAIDESVYESKGREERVIPSDIPDYSSHVSEVEKRDKEASWYTEGFHVEYHVGDNATGHSGSTFVFKATEEQLQGYLKNQHFMINDEREQHGKKKVSFDKFWKKITDAEGNVIYKASWKGPEPVTKLLPSERARFTNYELTYDPASHIAVCVIEDGGGID